MIYVSFRNDYGDSKTFIMDEYNFHLLSEHLPKKMYIQEYLNLPELSYSEAISAFDWES